jgi:hypothetical protein
MNTRTLPINFPPLTLIVGGDEDSRRSLMNAILYSHPHIVPVCFLQPVADAVAALVGEGYDHLRPEPEKIRDLETELYQWTLERLDPAHLGNIGIAEILNNEAFGVDCIASDCINPVWWKQLIAKFGAKNVLFVQLPPGIVQLPESSRVVRPPSAVPSEAMAWLRRELEPGGTLPVPSLQETGGVS